MSAHARGCADARRGSVLVIVLVICLGLASLVLYFASSVQSELRACADEVGDREAAQAVEAGIRYAAYVLNNYAVDGRVPATGLPPQQTQDYLSANLPVGDDPDAPRFWFIGRDPNYAATTDPVFGLVDEPSKLGLNSATAAMIEALPVTAMTTDLATAIVGWRSASRQTANGTLANIYPTLDPPRTNKGAAFESTDEARLVYGATLDALLGEDTNRNGALDPNEDDGAQTPPNDNQDGQLQPGLLDYVTAFSAQPATTHSGAARLNVSTLNFATVPGQAALASLLQRRGISGARATVIRRNLAAYALAPANGTVRSLAEFAAVGQFSGSEFARIHTYVTAAQPTALVNVNTASAAVLACIPGIGTGSANALVSYRLANPASLTSLTWIFNVLSRRTVRVYGPWITDQSYQFSADIAAVGRHGRGHHRERVVFDTTGRIPRLIYRQDLTAFGWALGDTVRQQSKTPSS